MTQTLSGPAIRRRMRVNGHTIRSLAARMNVPMTRVRQVRANGVSGAAFVADWLEWTQ